MCLQKCDEKFSNSKKFVKLIARQHGNDGSYQCRLCRELYEIEPDVCRFMAVVIYRGLNQIQ